MTHSFDPDATTTTVAGHPLCVRCGFPASNRRMHTIARARTYPIDSVPATGLNHPHTSHVAAATITPALGTEKARILAYIADQPGRLGATADEVQTALCGTHQSVSAAVNGLMRTGLITTLIINDKPVQRHTRSGRWAGAWRVTPAGSQALGRVLGIVRP